MPKLFSSDNEKFLQIDRTESELNKFICKNWKDLFPQHYTFIHEEFTLEGNVRSSGDKSGRIDILGFNQKDEFSEFDKAILKLKKLDVAIKKLRSGAETMKNKKLAQHWLDRANDIELKSHGIKSEAIDSAKKAHKERISRAGRDRRYADSFAEKAEAGKLINTADKTRTSIFDQELHWKEKAAKLEEEVKRQARILKNLEA
jgi:hypothetical protein